MKCWIVACCWCAVLGGCGPNPVGGVDLGAADIAGFAPTGVDCHGVQCAADEYCLHTSPGAPAPDLAQPDAGEDGGAGGPEHCRPLDDKAGLGDCRGKPICDCLESYCTGGCFVADGVVWCAGL